MSDSAIRLDAITRDSHAVEAGVRAAKRLRAVYRSISSRFRIAYRRSVLGVIALAYTGSALHRLVERSLEAARHSWLYRWLTKEPEPDVIVIDLRKTLTVGPFVAVLDRLTTHLESATVGASSIRLARRLAPSPIQVVSAIFLGLIVAILGESWPPTLPLVAVSFIAAVGAVLSLAVDDSRTALDNSRLVDILVVALSPPEE